MENGNVSDNNNGDGLDAGIEAVLFVKGEPMAVKDLAKLFQTGRSEIEEALAALKEKLSGRGLTLVRKEDLVSLANAPRYSEMARALVEEETGSKLTKAGLETLAIVAYKGPVSRPEIDYIRGVNSSFILRNLLVRGLVERIIHPEDSRSFLYKPSFGLLRHLGVGDISELPEYGDFSKKMNEFVRGGETAEETTNDNDNENDNENDNYSEEKKETVGDSDIAF